MNDELHDDIRRWPDDPKSLFGVSDGVSRKDLKRAYTRQIRRFKPEHFPDQFRRLREAFEELDRRFEWRDRVKELQDQSQADESDLDLDESSTSQAPVHDAATAPVSGNESSTTQHHEESVVRRDSAKARNDTAHDDDQIWQQVLDGGDLTSAYKHLVDGSIHRPKVNTFARLYWLLTVKPDLDSSRHSLNWLINGICKHGCNNQLLQMFSIEVRRLRSFFSTSQTDVLLDENFPLSEMVDIVTSRWHLARANSRFDVIQTDLDTLRDRFIDDRIQWQRLLFGGVRCVVISDDKTASTILSSLCKEIQEIPADLANNWVWDWFDSIMSLHHSWSFEAKHLLVTDIGSVLFMEIDGVPMTFPNTQPQETLSMRDRLVKLVEVTWERPPTQFRSEVQSICAALLKSPTSGIYQLTALAKVAPSLVHRFLELIHEQLAESTNVDDFEITPALQDEMNWFVDIGMWEKKCCHLTVLEFCLNQAVLPGQISEVIETRSADLPEPCLKIAQFLRNDLPLRCLVEAQRLLWSSAAGG